MSGGLRTTLIAAATISIAAVGWLVGRRRLVPTSRASVEERLAGYTVALSWLARPGVFKKQIQRRTRFLESELAREREVLRSVLQEVGHPYHEAVWMLKLTLEQFKTELAWLKKLEQELPRRAPAQNC